MKSGEKDIKFNHLAQYKLMETTGLKMKEIYEKIDDMQDIDKLDLKFCYDLLYCTIKGYKTKDDMLEDLPNDLSDVFTKLADAMGKHFTAGKENTNHE